jgi:hypothetical protein
MIFYVAHREHAYTQAVVLLYLRTDLQASFRLVRYEDAGLLRGVRAGVVIWSDMDRLTSDELSRAAAISAELLRRLEGTVVRDPRRSPAVRRVSVGLTRLIAEPLPDARLPLQTNAARVGKMVERTATATIGEDRGWDDCAWGLLPRCWRH